MSLAERRWLRLFTLTLLFFAQGIPWGFFAIAMPAYVAGLDVGEAGIASLIAMSYWPFAFKWLCGPVIDAFTIPRLGRRRPWILLAQTMMAVTMAALVLVDDPRRQLDLLVWLVLAHTVFNAMQNVAVDALAIDLLPENERGRANGLMYGAKYAGGALGAAGMSRLIEAWGFHATVLVQAALLAAIAVVPLLVRERSDAASPPRSEVGDVLRTLGKVFRLRSPALCALVMLLALIAGGMLNVVAPVLFIRHLHWDQADYSFLAGGPGLLVGAVGASLAGFLADRYGHRKLVALAMAGMGLVWLVFAAAQAWWTSRPFIYALIVAEPLAQSIMIVSLWTLCMDNSVPRTAATQFATYTSLTNLSNIIGARLLGAHIGNLLDFRATYVVAGALQIAIVLAIPFIDPQQARAALGEPTSTAPRSSPGAAPA